MAGWRANATVRGVDREPGVIQTCSTPSATRPSTNVAQLTSSGRPCASAKDGLAHGPKLHFGLPQLADGIRASDNAGARIELRPVGKDER